MPNSLQMVLMGYLAASRACRFVTAWHQIFSDADLEALLRDVDHLS
jgi:hypothetical protein